MEEQNNETRKPPVEETTVVPTAYDILNQFLKERNIVLGLSRPNIVQNQENGQIVIDSPRIIAVFQNELPSDTKVE